jgi:hypothetical protein
MSLAITENLGSEDFYIHFGRTLHLLEIFQTDRVSGIFELLDRVSYVNLIESSRDELMRCEDAAIGQFYKELSQLNTALERKYSRSKKKEARDVAAIMIAQLNKVKSNLEKEEVKKKVHATYANFEPYEQQDYWSGHPFEGLMKPPLRPGVWLDFRPFMIDRGDGSEDYFEWLSRHFEAILTIVEKFEAGYVTPISKDYLKNCSKFWGFKHGLVREEKWGTFLKICDALCVERKYKDSITVRFINYDEQADSYTWCRSNEQTGHDGSIPAFSQFLKFLRDHSFFSFQGRGAKKDICTNYLTFFDLPITQSTVKYLGRLIDGPKSEAYVDLFETPSLLKLINGKQ